MQDLVLACFKVVFECNSVSVSAGIVPEVMFGVEVATEDVQSTVITLGDLVKSLGGDFVPQRDIYGNDEKERVSFDSYGGGFEQSDGEMCVVFGEDFIILSWIAIRI